MEATIATMEEPPLWSAVFTYVNFITLYIFGILRDIIHRFMRSALRKSSKNIYSQIDFVPLFQSFESFYTRNIYSRVRDCFSRPVCSSPGVVMKIKHQIHTDCNSSALKLNDPVKEVINFGSYNYLGFAKNSGKCVSDSIDCIKRFGIAQCSANREYGYTSLHARTERKVANFIGSEDAIVFGMGFATNSTSIPTLVGKGCLILSDELNHSSIVLGCKLSGAVIKVFRHNDLLDLERKLKEYIISGNPRTLRPWKKILIIVEGIYSMEGTISPLPQLIALKNKYHAYLFVDEAHSIGAIGKHGKGIVDYFSCNPRDVDILMGTFTKSFNSCGGYIAGNKDLISHLRKYSHAQFYASSMSPPIMQQIIGVIDHIEASSKDSAASDDTRVAKLAWNTKYLRTYLKSLNYIVYGDDNSPVIPVMLFATSKIGAFNREMLKRNIAVVTVGFPATSLTLARVRFCVSAGHTKEMLDKLIQACAEVGDLLNLRVSKRTKAFAKSKSD
ncbi:hypothetical protein GJ496_007418 [Pomphorhynchus laevis]|nr:hypothetical protein GJ496_007418 [Pomphorhynchus laevis]